METTIILIEEKIYKIYYLSDPRNKELVRYIGYTKHTLTWRYNQHMCDKRKNHKTNWIKSLLKEGIKPVIELIEDGLTYEEALLKEVEYIKLFKSFGAKLVNSTDGGEGRKGWKPTPEQKERNRIAQLGKKGYWKDKNRPKETKEKISKTLSGRKGHAITEETKKKISKSNSGKKRTEEVKQRLSEIKTGNKNGLGWMPTEKQLEKMREKATGNQNGKNWKPTEDQLQKMRKPRMNFNSEIYQIDVISGEVINKFTNGQEAKKKFNATNGIYNCANGKLNTSKGYKWKWEKDLNEQEKQQIQEKLSMIF